MITDGVNSYAVFTFKCGELNWSRSPTIGFNAASDFYQNHELTGSPTADSLDCFNFPTSDYYNVVYNISVDNVQTTAPPVTVEPRMYYIPPLSTLTYQGRVFNSL